MSHCLIYPSQIYLPLANSSRLRTLPLPTSSHPTVADCAFACFDTNLCKTAVFDAGTNVCDMFSEVAGSTGQLVSAPSSELTTIGIQNPPESLISLAGNTGVYAIWNTTAGGNSLTSSPGFSTGRYWYSQNVTNVFDGLWDTFYCGYRQCNVSFPDVSCGQNTGLYVTLQHGPFILSAFRMVKGNFSSTRDPMRITIEGSNQNGMNLTFGSSWTPLYNGTAGLDINPGFRNAGVKQSLVNNQLRFSSYRFLILAKRGNETCTEYAEIELFGY